jgi:hypothetical protein
MPSGDATNPQINAASKFATTSLNSASEASPAYDLELNLDNFGGAVVSAGNVRNKINGSKSHQNYAFEIGADEDFVNMTGGFGSAMVAGGAEVTMAGGNNAVSLVLGLDRLDKSVKRQKTLLNGGASAEGEWLTEDEFASGLNTLTFEGSAVGVTMTIESEEKLSLFNTNDYSTNDVRYDSGHFRYFHHISGTNYGDTITVQNTNSLKMLQLGLGDNLVTLDNVQDAEIHSRASGANTIKVQNNSQAVIETTGLSASYTEVLSDSAVLAKLGGISDVLILHANSTDQAGVILTKEGTHTIDIDKSGADVHVSGSSNTTFVNHTYRTELVDSVTSATADGLVQFILGASLFNQLIRRTDTGIQVVSSDGSKQVLNYGLKNASSIVEDLAAIGTSSNFDDLGLDNVWFTGRPSLLSQTQWTADLHSMIQAMARLDDAQSATTSFNGETYYQMTQVFSNIHAQMTLTNP